MGDRPRSSSAARTAVEPMSSPMRPFGHSSLHVDGAVVQEALQLGAPDAVVLAHPHSGQLAALDQPVHGHVGHAHGGGDLATVSKPPVTNGCASATLSSSVTSCHTRNTSHMCHNSCTGVLLRVLTKHQATSQVKHLPK